MTSAVLMAGYNNVREVKKYSRIVAEHYGETFIESGYKPLREFTSQAGGKTVSKPLIQYTLDALSQCESVNEIIIVGHQALLEQKLSEYIGRLGKKCVILNQDAPLMQDVIKTFHITDSKFKHSSLAGNVIRGYAATEAFQLKKHALFVAADSPLTTSEFISRVVALIDAYESQADLIVPAIIMDGEKDGLGRLPLQLINDTEFPNPGRIDKHGRQGFRLSSLMSANLYKLNVGGANTAYNIRKLLMPKAQLELFRITRKLGYPNVFSTYFVKKNMRISEVEEILSVFFRGRFKLIPMEGLESTYDYDGTEHEYLKISKMLQKK
ncbi:MAG: nucleotidyltransferase family protein [Deltaproteobacteria bacterium]|nr:nucleotidyltransferase family protein [Deltaproteobacteria bacterium]